MTFWEAVSTCIATGGKLIEPKTMAANDAVAARFIAKFPGKRGFWIGITDYESEGR